MEKWVRHDEGHARVWAREGDAQALELARQWLAETLQGLETVPSAATARVQRGLWGARTVYFKEYFKRDAFESLKDLFRPSRAHRALRGAAVCEEAGFLAPRPVCLIEAGPRLFPSRSVLVTEAFEDAPCLRDWIEGRAGPLTLNARRELLRAVGVLVGRWHAGGMFHGDCHPGNLLCRREGEGMAFCWLDIERTRRYEGLPMRCRLNDLVKLNYERLPVSLTDRMRVWKAYVQAVVTESGGRGHPPSSPPGQSTPEGGRTRLPGPDWSKVDERTLLRRVISGTRARWREAGWI